MALRILALEPYAALSHRLHWEGLSRHGRHRWTVLTLPPRFWKLRMRTASIHFAREVAARAAAGEAVPDLYVASEYLSAAEFVALLPPRWRDVPLVVDFHENQLTYPLREGELRDLHFAFSHLHAALVARRIIFHSAFHRDEFIGALPALLRPVPDIDLRALPGALAARAVVLPLGTDVPASAPRSAPVPVPTVLWSHRWEHDKAPERFLEAVEALRADGERFRIRLLGQRFRAEPPELARLRAVLGEDLVGDEFIPRRADYIAALCAGDIAVSTARHEFFGLSSLEAIRSGDLPVLPAALSYPELLPAAAWRRPYLYPPAEGLAPALAEALALVRRGDPDLRAELVESTEPFTWERLAPRYDALFEECASGPAPPLP